jgi:hypothetical protein
MTRATIAIAIAIAIARLPGHGGRGVSAPGSWPGACF